MMLGNNFPYAELFDKLKLVCMLMSIVAFGIPMGLVSGAEYGPNQSNVDSNSLTKWLHGAGASFLVAATEGSALLLTKYAGQRFFPPIKHKLEAEKDKLTSIPLKNRGQIPSSIK
jgi:hypothetical protein